MMRYVPAILRRLFKPVPLMDARTDNAEPIGDPISRDLAAAVREHEETAERGRDTYERALRATIDELLERIGQPH